MPQFPAKPKPLEATLLTAPVLTPAHVPAELRPAPEAPRTDGKLTAAEIQPDGLTLGQQVPVGNSQGTLKFLSDIGTPRNNRAASRDTTSQARAQVLQSFFEQQLQGLDGDQNGFVSLKELDQAINTASPGDKARLLALRAHIDRLAAYANDEIGPETKGISRQDMQAFLRQAQAQPRDASIRNISGSLLEAVVDFSGRELLDFARDRFSAIDRDQNGFLSLKNLREALDGGSLSLKQQSMALKLMAYLEDFAALANDEFGKEQAGISQADLAKLIQQGEFQFFTEPKPGQDFQRMSAFGLPRPAHTLGASADYRLQPSLPKPALPAPSLAKNHLFPGAKMDAHLYAVDFGGQQIKIYVPTPTVANQPTAQDVLDALAALPALLRQELRVVQVSPVANPKDAEWARQYKMPGFISDMTTGADRVLNIYNWPADRPDQRVRSVQQLHEAMLHEGGHAYTETGAKGFKWRDWEAVMAADMVSPSSYASTDRGEDFSDSLRLYLLTKHNPFEAGIYEAEFPNRFKWFKAHGF